MNLDEIQTQCFILALFIRDDGERFLLGSGAYEFKDKQLHFTANSYANDIVEVQGNDGLLLAGQVRRPTAQEFEGFIGDATVSKQDVENYRKSFIAFFRKDYHYKVVYVFPDGTAIQRRQGFIVDAPEVKELYQYYPTYHVALNFEDVNYYSYAEDPSGHEVYGKSAKIYLSSGVSDGGLIWDADGVVWDAIGATWEKGSGGGATTVPVESIDRVYPIWELTGPAVNPQIEVITTNTAITYTGTVTATQTLRVDMTNKTATLNGSSVISNISGEWISLAPGDNRVVYTTDNADADYSTISWQEVVG